MTDKFVTFPEVARLTMVAEQTVDTLAQKV